MQKIWAEITSILEKQLAPGQYKVWVAPLAAALEGETLVIFAQSGFCADIIRSRFLSHIEDAAAAVLGKACTVALRVREGGKDTKNTTTQASAKSIHAEALETSRAKAALPAPRPLPAVQCVLPVRLPEPPPAKEAVPAWRFRFDDFIVGPCNELAHAASRSMCSLMGTTDMLFLSSATGLGKTHLLHAVGKELCDCSNRKAPKVEYLTAEEFASSFYLALKCNDTDRFKARYRDADLLLLEDVHFFQGKEKMQAEFLATLKALLRRGSKVVCTSSFSPRDFKQMDDQLQSRLCSGLFASIEKPDEETRRRILRSKASQHQVLLPPDVEEVLAHHIHSDVRQIESCLHNLALKARLFNSSITMQMAWDVIAGVAAQSPILDMESIISSVCRAFSLAPEHLFSASRKQEYVCARNTAFFLARKHTDLSLEAIGQRFNRKHSTVLKGITNLEREISRESSLGRQLSGALLLIEKNGNIARPE